MSYICLYVHCVFSTKERRPFLHPDIRSRVWSYMGGIARENRARAIGMGGVADHCHMLLSMPATLNLSDAMKRIKGGSSKWIKDTFPGQEAFAWQKEYGAFSVGYWELDRVRRYIANQEAHHRKFSFKDEFRKLLKEYNIEYDERYIWR